ncbi:MAG: hypothetical protein KJO07_25580, partial [Deltaproteobacteria bacterium]|nr:hypothetical protein [Deltaproteobacteria bacterium]
MLTVAAWAISVAVIVLGLRSLRFYLPQYKELTAASLGAAGFCTLIAVVWPSEVSRWLRALAVTPLIHLGVIVGTAVVLRRGIDSPFLETVHGKSMPLLVFVVGLALLVIVAAWLRRRSAERLLRGNFYFGCGLLLAIGLWVPIAGLADP